MPRRHAKAAWHTESLHQGKEGKEEQRVMLVHFRPLVKIKPSKRYVSANGGLADFMFVDFTWSKLWFQLLTCNRSISLQVHWQPEGPRRHQCDAVPLGDPRLDRLRARWPRSRFRRLSLGVTNDRQILLLPSDWWIFDVHPLMLDL